MEAEPQGGEAACWAHLFDAPDDHDCGPFVVAPDALTVGQSGGAVWSLPHGGDLDANLVRLDAGGTIGEHRNDEVDVLIVVRDGAGELRVDGVAADLTGGTVALILKGTTRTIVAGPDGVAYLSIHRGRTGLGISRPS